MARQRHQLDSGGPGPWRCLRSAGALGSFELMPSLAAGSPACGRVGIGRPVAPFHPGRSVGRSWGGSAVLWEPPDAQPAPGEPPTHCHGAADNNRHTADQSSGGWEQWQLGAVADQSSGGWEQWRMGAVADQSSGGAALTALPAPSLY